MPYVQRDEQGNIVGRFANSQPGIAEEWLDDDAADLRPVLTEVRARMLAQLKTDCETELSQLKADYPESEVSSWGKQEREARALLADPATATPLLSAIATARGIDLAELAARVLAKADAYAVAAGALIGRRQALEDALAAIDLAAPDAEAQIYVIHWENAA